jgi:hypothetical protein
LLKSLQLKYCYWIEIIWNHNSDKSIINFGNPIKYFNKCMYDKIIPIHCKNFLKCH